MIYTTSCSRVSRLLVGDSWCPIQASRNFSPRNQHGRSSNACLLTSTGRLTIEQLEVIAGKDLHGRGTRSDLSRKIENLKLRKKMCFGIFQKDPSMGNAGRQNTAHSRLRVGPCSIAIHDVYSRKTSSSLSESIEHEFGAICSDEQGIQRVSGTLHITYLPTKYVQGF